MELMQASRQWAIRPADERFTSLHAMQEHFENQKAHSKAIAVPSRALTVRPVDAKSLEIVGPQGHGYAPTNWAFGQLAQLSGAPAGYLRTLPAELASDCVNFGLQFTRDIEDIGVLIYKNGDSEVRAVTGPKYGRIWNCDIISHLVERFGDGVTGDWRVPGEFGKRVEVTKDNTTLFAGDRDMFIFLADEEHRIENPARDGAPLARGFFVWNSEVGSKTFGMATFLFDYVCCNRIVWGAQAYAEVTLRHTSSAPEKFMDEMRPALAAYANDSSRTITQAIQNAKQARLSGEDGELDKFLTARFGKRIGERLQQVHKDVEGKPIENLWDVTTAATEYAKGIAWQDERVEMERKAGEILQLASA